MTSSLAYSTSTDGTIVDNTVPEVAPTMDYSAMDEYLSDPHCFVCQRHTDHWGEHDDMVEAGTARYEDNGSVYPVPWAWDN
jgi:hypothetical protein